MNAGKLICFLLALIPFVPLSAAPGNEGEVNRIFYQANAAYKSGEYSAAIKDYEQLLGMGYESGNIYYNLGNSYFKSGRPGLAVLNYERAKRLIPNDSDLAANHEFALSSLDLSLSRCANPVIRLVRRVFVNFNADQLAVILSAIYALAMALFALALFLKGVRSCLAVSTIVLGLVFTAVALALKADIGEYKNAAVIVSESAGARFEPLDTARTYFKLGEGSKISVLDETAGWYKVRRADGRIGWISKDSAGLIAGNRLSGR